MALGMEVDGLLACEAALDRALDRERGERGQMLNGDVLLAAEAAAHEHGLDDDLLRRGVPAHHMGDLFARVVGALVGRADLHAVLVRERHGALGLQKRVLGRRRGEGARDLVRGACERGGSVAAHHVALLADVVLELDPVAEREELVVQKRGVVGAGLGDGAHGLELLVGDLDHLLGAFERGLVLGHHEADGVAHAAGNVALGDHDVPVVDEVADRVHGHVGSGEHGKHARKRAGLVGIDLDHAGARVLGAHGARVGEIRKVGLVDVVGVLAEAEHLAAHVVAEGALAHAVVVAALELGVDLGLAAQDLGGELDALDDLLVAGATADVALDGLFDLVLGGVGHMVDKPGARHYHAGNAEAALHGAHGAERVDEGLLLALGQALDGYDVAALGELGGEHAGADGMVVDQDGAGAARALGASVLGGVNVQVVAQVAQKRLLLGNGALDAVDRKGVADRLLGHGSLLSVTCSRKCRACGGSRAWGTWWRTCRS